MLRTRAVETIEMAESDCGIEFHPLSHGFPMMAGPEFEEFCADIGRNGLRRKITLLDGKILDGRDRMRAMVRRDRYFSPDNNPEKFEQFNPAWGDPFAWLVSQNFYRQHYNESQRAVIAADICLRKPASRWRAGARTADVAKAMDVSPGLVKAAKRVIRAGDADLVRSGAQRIGKRGAVKAINVVLPAKEHEAFVRACRGRTATDVLRELIRRFVRGDVQPA